jgi:hypothetical protein
VFEVRRGVSINALQVIAVGTPKRNEFLAEWSLHIPYNFFTQYSRIAISFH